MTIKEIADLAGVSKSTVSRVLNGSGSVNEQTRKKVLKLIKEYDYVPSSIARSLSSKSSNTIGWILPVIDSVFFGQITQGIDDALSSMQYTLMMSCTQNDFKRELKAIRSMRQQNICGLLITTSSVYEGENAVKQLICEVNDLKIPVVMIDRSVKGAPWNGIYSENYDGTYEATEALIRAGFTDVCGIFSDLALNLGKERYRGFCQAMRDHHLSDTHVYTRPGPAFEDDYYHLTCHLVQENKLPKAVFLSNGVIASGFFRAILEQGIRPGFDVHCMSFDYLEALSLTHTPYNYLNRNCYLFGRTALRILMHSFESKTDLQEKFIIPSSLELDDTLKALYK